MEAIQFTEEQRRWSETSLQLGAIAKSLSGKQEEATNNNFIGESLIKNGYFDQTIPGSTSPILGNELVQNGNFDEKSGELVVNGDFANDSVWNKGTGWSISGGKAIQSSGIGQLYQESVLTAGKSYSVSVTIDSIAPNTSLKVSLGTAGASLLFSNVGTTTLIGSTNPSVGDTILYLLGNETEFAGSISNISVIELDPNDRWTLGGGWSYGDSEVLRIPQSISTSCTQSINFVASKRYLIEYTIKVNAGDIKIRLSGGGGISETPARSSSGTYKEEIFASNSHTVLNLRAVDGTFDGSVLNVSVKEIEAVDIDLWETITNSLDSTIVFSNGFVTLDYDGDAGSLAIRQSNILTINDNYTVVIDYQMISGEAKFLLGATAVTLDSTTRVTETFNGQCTNSDDFAIARKTEGQAMKMIVYSVAVYKIDNSDWTLGSNWSIDRGQGLKGSGAGNNNAVQSFTAVAGQTYRVEYKISSYTQGSVRVQIGGTNGTANASVGTFIENVVTTNTGDIAVQNVQVGIDNFIGTIEYIKIQSGEQSDTLDMTDPAPKALWVVAPGNLKVTTMAGDVTSINDLEADTFIDWLRIKKVWLTGTTITDIIGIY